MRLLYQQHIEKAGYQLLAASSAEESLTIIRQEKPALIIMDVILTGAGGLAALRAIKADNATQNIPVIVFTGATTEEHHATRQEAMASGAAMFLTKPISPAQLLAEIERLSPPGDRTD